MDAIYTESLANDGSSYWYTSWEDNGIYRTDIRTGETECVDTFSEEPIRNQLYGSVALYGNFLVAIPRRAKKIAIYNITEKNIQYISFNLPEEKHWRGGYFGANIVFQNYIFMLGLRYPIILRLDMETYEVSYYREWYTEVKKYIMQQEFPRFFATDVCVEDGKFYVPLCCVGYVLCFDMEAGETELIRIGDVKGGYETLCSDGKDFWLASSTDRKLIRWNHISGEIREYQEFPKGCFSPSILFFKSFYCDNEIFLVCKTPNKIIRMNPTTGIMSELQTQAVYKPNNPYAKWWYAEPAGKHKIRMINSVEKCWHELDLQTEETSHYYYSCSFPEAFFLKHDGDKKRFLDRGGVFLEGYWRTTIEGFLRYIQDMQKDMKQFLLSYVAGISVNADGSCGRNVLENVTRDLF